MVEFSCFKDGKTKAVTLSYDDGRNQDRRLVEIFNKYGVKGTFHLASSFIGADAFLQPEEIKELYKGHEISLHTYSHPFTAKIPTPMLVEEITKDRLNLEKLAGYVVNGMSYPMGSFDKETADLLRKMGILYSRTTISTNNFNLPEDFLMWHPTMRHGKDKEALLNKAKEFVEIPDWRCRMPVFYLWGHSYEFDDDNNWDLIEDFCKYISAAADNIWFATNMEIYNYVTAVKALRFSADCSMVYNPSDISVWVGIDKKPVEIKPGETKNL